MPQTIDHGSVSPASASVPALRRAIAIMDYISVGSAELNAAELCRILNIPKSTGHGLLMAMEELGLIQRDSAGRFGVGPASLRWSNAFLARSDVVTAFRRYFVGPHLLEGYTITMTVLEGTDVVYVACAQANQPLGVTFRTGMRLPAPFTATGKALLASLPPEELEARFKERFPAPLTPYSVKDLAQLRRELQQIDGRGFSIDDGETREGMVCLGATVRDHEGKVQAGLALSLTRDEATAETVVDLGEQLTDAAASISRMLGAI